MKSLRKRMIKGILIILSSMMTATLMTILYDWLVRTYGHEERFQIIFGVGGGIIAFAVVFYALIVWTRNFGEGIKEYGDESEYIRESKNIY